MSPQAGRHDQRSKLNCWQGLRLPAAKGDADFWGLSWMDCQVPQVLIPKRESALGLYVCCRARLV